MGLLDAPVIGLEAELSNARRENSRLKNLLGKIRDSAKTSGEQELVEEIDLALKPRLGW